MTDFVLASVENVKMLAIFDILMTITPGANMITRQTTHFFHLLFELYQLVYFIFAFKDLQNPVLWGPPFALFSGP